MNTNFVEELKWRGMLHDIMPDTEELLTQEMVSGYIGFDPTADSLGVGNMVQIMTLVHFPARRAQADRPMWVAPQAWWAIHRGKAQSAICWI